MRLKYQRIFFVGVLISTDIFGGMPIYRIFLDMADIYRIFLGVKHYMLGPAYVAGKI